MEKVKIKVEAESCDTPIPIDLNKSTTNKDEEKDGSSDKEKSTSSTEACLLFLGTFDHESCSEPNADLVQLKENSRITEVRVIPLGAEVGLPNGACQLGATNPAEMVLEFYYSDLQNASKSTFALLETFQYQEKAQIQLSCRIRDPEILTDAIMIRGHYATLTLALYGYSVGDAIIKQIEIITEEPVPIPDPTEEELHMRTPEIIEEDVKIPISTLVIKEETSMTIKSEEMSEIKLQSCPVVIKEQQHISDRLPLSIDVPQAIPTISTRVNFSPIRIQIPVQQHAEAMDIGPVNPPVKIEVVSSDEEQFDEISCNEQSKVPEPLPLLMETEDISDGEISDEMEDFRLTSSANIHKVKLDILGENEVSLEKLRKPISTLSEKLSAVQPQVKEENKTRHLKKSSSQEESPHELLSDQEDSFGDEFLDPAVEEIISDEEMPDYGDYEYNEWDDQWSQKFSKSFNPFLASYQVQQLPNLQIDVYMRRSSTEDKFAAGKLLGAITKFSDSEFDSVDEAFIESWVEKMEQLLPVLPQALNAIGEDDQEVLKATKFWVQKGLDLDLVKNQSSIKFKIRHIKAGLKLVHCVCNYGGFISEQLLKLKFEESGSLQEKLLDVLIDDQLKSIVSIQTLTLKSLDATLSTRLGFEMFSNWKNGNANSGFQRLINYFMEGSKTTRVSFAFRTFLNKVTFMSNILLMEPIAQAIIDDEDQVSASSTSPIVVPTLGKETVSKCAAFLKQLSLTASRVDQALAFPVRILPAETVFELPPPGIGHDPKLNFIRLLRETELMKICSVLLTCKEANTLATPICELIQCLIGWEEGLVYLYSEAVHTTLVIKAFLRSDEKRKVALEFAHCLEVIRCVDVLKSELESDTVSDNDEDIRRLQQLYSFLSTPTGRNALLNTLSIGNLIAPLLQCIRQDSKLNNDSEKLNRLVKSARKGYSLDIIIFIVKFTDSFEFLRDHGAEIHELIIFLTDHYEGCDKLSELLPFLKPTMDKQHFTHEGIESLCQLIKGKLADFLQVSCSQEHNWGFTPEILTALRILWHFGASEEDDVTSILQGTDDVQTSKELKFMMSYVRMNSEDLLSDFTVMLGRVLKDFEHLAIQSYLLAGSKGDALISFLLSLVRLFRRILTRIIQVRNKEFRDLTPVPYLLQIFALVKSYPESSLSQSKADEVEVQIINTLLAYTIPTMRLGEESEEELTKSVWTAMINEIIKFTWTSPANFIPGVTVLSELLPFPFPIQTNIKLTDEESAEWVRQKRLWSAYLHGASNHIQELIGILCESAHPELLTTLKQLCLKLADLSASTCLVVCRAVMNQVIASIEIDFEKNSTQRTCDSTTTTSFVKAWVETAMEDRTLHCSQRTARLLEFLASLISSHGVFKAGVTQIYRVLTKIDDKFQDFISMLCSILTSWPTKDFYTHAQGQRHIVTIFQGLCDVEFNLFVTGSDVGRLEKQPSPEYIRPNSLPQKDILVQICSAFLTYLNIFELNITALKASIAENVLHALQIISETEYGFYHLRISLDKSSGVLNTFVNKLSRPLQSESAISPMIEIVTAFMNFLNCLITSKEDSDHCLAVRQNILNTSELWKIFSWVPVNQSIEEKLGESLETQAKSLNSGETISELKETTITSDILDKSTGNKENRGHPLVQLKAELEKWIGKIDESQETYQIFASLEGSLETLNKLMDLMSATGKPDTVPTEIFLAAPDSLAEVFAHRPVSIFLEERAPLSSCYLTSFPTTFYEGVEACPESELVKCDLVDIALTNLPGLDLIKELEGFFKRNMSSNLSDMRNQIEVVDLKLKPFNEFPYAHGDGGFHTGLGLSHRKPPFHSGMRGNSARVGFGRGMQSGPGRPGPHGFDPFRSRPPNTSRPPSLHVDDFVALESSGSGSQSNFNKSGPRTGLGRGQRGSTAGRPFNNMDRGRSYRSPQAGSSYYQRNDVNSPNLMRGRGRGQNYGRGGSSGGGGNPRWGNTESHSQNQGFGSGRSDNGRNYDDKFRGGLGRSGPIRTSVGSRQSFSRHPYRDSPNSDRSQAPSNSNMNTNTLLRWRDRSRPFNR